MSTVESSLTGPPRGRLDKRRAILDAAGEVFAREGYAQSSVDVIAAEAGVAKPTIYNHLGGKENLFRAVMIQMAEDVTARTLEVLESFPSEPKDLRGELHAVGHRLVSCLRGDQSCALRRLLDAEVQRFPELYRTVRVISSDHVIDALAGKLAVLANAGHLRVDDPSSAASQFIALISDRLAQLSGLGTQLVEQETVDGIVAAGVETFLRAFAT